VVLIAVLLGGCASSGRTISRIHPGQDIEKIRKSIGPITENFFEVLEEGSLHHYIQARHPDSGVLFGLYFENGNVDCFGEKIQRENPI